MSKDKDSKPTGDNRVDDLLKVLKETRADLADFIGLDYRREFEFTPEAGKSMIAKIERAIDKAEKDNNR